jgi:hypothetical protein
MNTLRPIFLCIGFVALVATSSAQTFDEDLHLEQAEAATSAVTSDEATTLILNRLRSGEQQSVLNLHLLTGFSKGGNFALVHQAGEDNAALVNQIGLANLAVIDQEGERNRTELEQIGQRNIFGAWLRGDENFLSLLQQGDDNIYILDFVGDKLDHAVEQIGSGIQAVQVGYGSQPFGIQQHGEGMDIRIEHNRY